MTGRINISYEDVDFTSSLEDIVDFYSTGQDVEHDTVPNRASKMSEGNWKLNRSPKSPTLVGWGRTPSTGHPNTDRIPLHQYPGFNRELDEPSVDPLMHMMEYRANSKRHNYRRI